MVDGSLGCKDNSRKIGNVYLLLTEFFCRKPFNLEERSEYDFDIVLVGNVVIWRFFRSRLRLGNENFLDFHSSYWLRGLFDTRKIADCIIRITGTISRVQRYKIK